MSHRDLLALLLPPGVYDPAAPYLAADLAADGNALDAALWSADQVLAESDPRTCSVTLADWERVYGLPEPELVAAGITLTVAERRAALVAKVTMQGGQSRQFFIDLARALGYTVTVSELSAFRIEHSSIEDPLRDLDWTFVWQVNAPATTVREFQIEASSIEDPLRSWGNALLEAVIRRYRPAHTYVIFSYGG